MKSDTIKTYAIDGWQYEYDVDFPRLLYRQGDHYLYVDLTITRCGYAYGNNKEHMGIADSIDNAKQRALAGDRALANLKGRKLDAELNRLERKLQMNNDDKRKLFERAHLGQMNRHE